MSTEVIELGELNTNIGESISLNTSALPNNDTPTRSANFGLGAELLMNEKKKDKVHEHFVNDDPTQFEHEKMEKLAKEAIKKFKSL